MTAPSIHSKARHRTQGSVLIIVLWIAFGLVALALYFADAMTFEMRTSDNRTAGLVAEQAIDAGARYVSSVLATFATNGGIPNLTQYRAEAVPIGSAHFWIIGRDPSGTAGTEPYFAMIDEASKLNVNYAGTNALLMLPNITSDFVQAITDWRSSSSSGLTDIQYAPLNYSSKKARFETLNELRLLSGANVDLLAGADINGNGILDNEVDVNHNAQVQPGLFEYLTVYSREPNQHSDGTALTNVNNRAQLTLLLSTTFGVSRANQILANLTRRVRGSTNAVLNASAFTNPLQFYLRSGMTSAEFGQIAGRITTTSAAYIYGRVNINTASPTVLSCLPGMDLGTAQQLVNYRSQNPTALGNILWIVDALGVNSSIIQALAQGDYITTHSYQFTADIAALGPYGRGYRRSRFVFDVSGGAVQVVYRQDLSRLGWALGKNVRLAYVDKNAKGVAF